MSTRDERDELRKQYDEAESELLGIAKTFEVFAILALAWHVCFYAMTGVSETVSLTLAAIYVGGEVCMWLLVCVLRRFRRRMELEFDELERQKGSDEDDSEDRSG